MWRVECHSIVEEREEGFLTPRTAFGMTIYIGRQHWLGDRDDQVATRFLRTG